MLMCLKGYSTILPIKVCSQVLASSTAYVKKVGMYCVKPSMAPKGTMKYDKLPRVIEAGAEDYKFKMKKN